MIATDYLNVSKYINFCPNCGSAMLGKEEGSISIDENIIKRSCKCGFDFEYDVNNGTTKKKINEAIFLALQEMDK